ncbi:MAG: SMP-30/gluconolactonase/LRE family protein [Paraglaciecola sp.]|uniref:SMP-30/gluconolactonase/LRE family protein n=1 Tax=Paraglaciecola sp. TaxID=1920173 RepID=UPI00273D0CED|nr:SMP-30/gluconolactonase/LRE family protein [Paraglaciecola sp.]MDP5029738.1 SMP-30/gluconolactonase/LRE family protein [Paraglaciecola sp.]MDP5131644.1 SMP-30/gluconolactonase/LRE family protein [Paraglaciecola sp.]
MNNELILAHQLLVNNTLGEGVIWDHRTQRLYWTDILQNKLYCWDFDGNLQRYPCPEALASFGFTDDPQWLICAFASGFAFFNPRHQEVRWLNQLNLPIGVRLNDGRVDRQGRFWAGSLVDKTQNAQDSGSLYRLNFDASISEQTRDVHIANSLCWSIDSKKVYFADSPKRCIQTASFDATSGNIGPFQDFVHTDRSAFPDGACIDSEGCLWSAQWGSATVKRYSPQGSLLLTLTVPCKQPSCVSFAGENLQYLCVTSAWQDLKETQISQYDGGLFIYKTPYTGLPEALCKMPMSAA